ncbi:MAG: hypothetical protein GYA47_01290, partial [Desulfovibrio sp.]|nr:hypothetical protein [Desulfovibrio sp.]
MNHILRIEAGKAGPPRTWSEPVGEYVGLGGRAMVSRIIRSEVPPGSSPLGPDNKVVMAPGLMGGFADCAESLSMGCKSPLTNGLNLAMCGGAAGDALARLGYAAVVVQGRDSVDGLYTVIISKGGVRSEPAEDLRALCARDMAERLRARHGRDVSVIGLGPAGKRRMASAAISVIPPGSKTAPCIGRGGDGAVLGSKGVKAIVLDASGTPPRQPVRPGRFLSACRRFKKELSRPAAVPSGPTDDGAPPPSAGSLPPRERAALAMGLLHQKEGSRAVRPALALFPDCLGCGRGPCPNLLDGQGADDLRRPGVDAVFAFGQGCGLNIEAIRRLDALCADYDLDPMEVDLNLRMAIQAGQLRRDDPDRALEIVRGIGQGTISRRMSGAWATKVAARCGMDRDMPNLDEMRAALASDLYPDKEQAELACSLLVVAMTLEMVGCCPYL